MVKKILLLLIFLIVPSAVMAIMLLPLDDPEQSIGIPDNTVYDIIQHNGAVWFATDRGVAFSYFNDSIWNIYDETNGLISNSISAIYSSGDTIWVAMNHLAESGEGFIADGLAITSDDGLTWDTLQATGTVGPLFIVYDITGVDSLIFCASWVGGLTASFDNGLTWRNIYHSRQDSVEHTSFLETLNSDLLPLYSRYFSAVVDTTHPDSLILWGGTANGIYRFVWGPEYARLASNYVFDVVSADDYIFICGDSGLTRMKYDSVGGQYVKGVHSTFAWDDFGLPELAVTTAYKFADRLFIGQIDSTVMPVDSTRLFYSENIGFAYSDDNGETFSTMFSGLDDLIGQGRYPVEFASVGDNLFIAAKEAGLFVSADTGLSWTRLAVDSLDASFANPRNIVHSIAADSNNLWVGTDTGLVIIRFDDTGVDTLHQYIPFTDGAFTGAKIHKVALQHFVDTVGVLDSILVYTLNHPADTSVGNYAAYFSSDYGQSWTETLPFNSRVPMYDIDFFDDLAIATGEDIYSFTIDRAVWTKYDAERIRDLTQSPIISLNNLDLNAVLVVLDTVYIGSANGLAGTRIGFTPYIDIVTEYIDRANHDPRDYDQVTNIRYPTLTSNFVSTLDIQPLPNGKSRVYASASLPVNTGEFVGISSGSVDGFNDWRQEPHYVAWNFAFNGEETFAATSQGVLYSRDTGLTWVEVPISGVQLSSVPPVDAEIDPNLWVTAMDLIDDSLWIGTTGGGAARIALSSIQNDLFNDWWIYKTYDSSVELYSYPNPYSLARGGKIYFHFNIPQNTTVSLDIYDFALDHVATVIDNKRMEKGIHNAPYRENPADDETWDGYNDQGDAVAVGMYYYKLALSSGNVYWGKIAIVP